ncbi:MAG: DUF1549 domain-containing protein [Planctomycetota bacterium]|nr:DUF1549 domain-containing protein [Planctomycetota bacterium]
MTDIPDDPIIDACLEEVLGGQLPPDLTARILRAWDASGHKAAGGPSAAALATQVAASRTAEPTTEVKVRDPKRAGNSRRKPSPWLTIAASLAIVGIGSAFVWVAWNATERQDQRPNQIAAPGTPLRDLQVSPVPPPGTLAEIPLEPRRERPAPAFEPTKIPDDSLAIDPVPAIQDQEPIPEINIPDERPAPLADEQIVRAINELVRDHWRGGSITPAVAATDEQWCQRVYVKLIGREPRPGEVSSFVESRYANKRELLVDLLLGGDTYIEEFASHWSRTWADILVASGNNQTNRDGLEQYLRRAFGDGKPFDQTTYELLTATGSGKIGSSGYNGATNFLLAHADSEGVHADATAHVSRTFMAHSLECSQCHNDGIWSVGEQHQFWELNAFFRQLEVKRDRDRGLVVSDTDLVHRDRYSDEGGIFYALVNGLMKHAYPIFVDGTEIPKTPLVSQVNRRDLLAKFITRSEQFRQAMANRFWAELFGVGFTIPADNIGPHNPPSHPELLAKLGGQFAAHDYDVRALIRWIVLSEPFALSTGDVATDDQIGARLAFDRFPQPRTDTEPVLKRLQVARQAYASIASNTGTNSTPARVAPTTIPGAVPTELNDVDKLLATVATEARRLSKATVYGNYILESDMSREQKVRHMFYATLHRAPTASEQKAVEEVLANDGTTSVETALEYIWWALAASQEAR